MGEFENCWKFFWGIERIFERILILKGQNDSIEMNLTRQMPEWENIVATSLHRRVNGKVAEKHQIYVVLP